MNEKGEFISEKEGEEVLKIAEDELFNFAEINSLGKIKKNDTYFQKHISKILSLPLVDVNAIRARKFKVVIEIGRAHV